MSKVFQYKSDIKTYRGADSGCHAATYHLGRQSSCFRCPFPKCVFDELGVGIGREKKGNRNEEIRQRYGRGERAADLAKEYGVSKRTIWRAIKRDDRDG